MLGEVAIKIVAFNYPSIGKLYIGTNVNQVLRTGFTLATTYCTGPGLTTMTIPSGAITSLGTKFRLESEHTLDVWPLPTHPTRILGPKVSLHIC